MPVIVTQPTTINVRVGSATQPRISQTSIFQGALSASLQSEIEAAFATANSAFSLANTSLQTTGGIITGNLEVTGNVYVDQTFTAVVDAGYF